jgi:hypothetical protein
MIASFFCAQDQLFIPGPAFLLAAVDPYRLFAQKVMPVLVEARPLLAQLYCGDNGRPGIEPVLLLAVGLLQFWERVPDAQAVALLNWHLGWAFAVGWPIGQEPFHPSALSRFRQRLLQHKQAALVFEQLVKALVACGLVKGQTSRRLDSTFILGLVSHMGRLECVRETLRLALEELNPQAPSQGRPTLWPVWWERYVESQLDYRAEPAVLQAKLRQAGEDMAGVLAWINPSPSAAWAIGAKVQLLRRVFAEQFDVSAAAAQTPDPWPKEKTPAGAVKNPHDPQAQWAKKGSGAQKKEVVGYKVQVCETAQEQPLAKGQPTQQFLLAVETQLATASDERGLDLVAEAQARLSLAQAPITYVDAAYISGAKLAQAKAEGRELIGPAPGPPHREGRYSAADFDVRFDPLRAYCPAGHLHASSVQWQDAPLVPGAPSASVQNRNRVPWRLAPTMSCSKHGAANKPPPHFASAAKTAMPWKALRANWSGLTACAKPVTAGWKRSDYKTISSGRPAMPNAGSASCNGAHVRPRPQWVPASRKTEKTWLKRA